MVEIDKKKEQRKAAAKQDEKLKEKSMEKKLKKTVKIENTVGKRNQMLEQITETTFHRTRTVQRGTQGHESDGSDWDMPQVEWKKVTPPRRKDKYHQSLSREEPQKLWSFWDLLGSERTDNIRPENMLQLEASSEWESPQGNSSSTNVPNIIELDLTADSTSESPEISLVANKG